MLSREERLTAAVQFFANREDVPAFPKHVHGVVQSVEGDDSGIDQVVAIIEQSVGLSLLVLREANLEAKVRDSRRVSTVRRAVSGLGIWRIRDLAIALVGSDAFHRRPSPARELLFQASVNGSAARHLSLVVSPAVAPEATTCGMFRNLGEFLLSCYLPDLYEEVRIQQAATNDPVEVVCTEVLQFTYEDLAQRVARYWGWPENVIRALRASRPFAFIGGSSDLLNTITACSHALTDCLGQGAAADAFDKVVTDYSPILRIERPQFQRVLRMACEETIASWASAIVQVDARRIRRQLQAAIGEEQPKATEPPVANEAGDGVESVTTGDLSRLAAVVAQSHVPPQQNEARVLRY